MGAFVQLLLALLAAAGAVFVWFKRRDEGAKPAAAPQEEEAAEPQVQWMTEEIYVEDPKQAERIAALEEELAAARAVQAEEEAAAQAQAAHLGEVEEELAAARQLLEEAAAEAAAAAAAEAEAAQVDAAEALAAEAAAEPEGEAEEEAEAEAHLQRVALWGDQSAIAGADVEALWRALASFQAFAAACGEAEADCADGFAGWCAASGHASALPADQLGTGDGEHVFTVPSSVHSSGRAAAPQYVQAGRLRLHYLDDLGGYSGRIHVFLTSE